MEYGSVAFHALADRFARLWWRVSIGAFDSCNGLLYPAMKLLYNAIYSLTPWILRR